MNPDQTEMTEPVESKSPPASSAELIGRIVEGIRLDDALAAFVAACNRRNTLFIPERWFAPYREKLFALLSDPITADEAHVLQEILWQRLPFEVVFAWLDEKPVSWGEYQLVKKAEAEGARWRTMVEGIFPWPEVEASRADAELQKTGPEGQPLPESLASNTCPCCQQPLTWVYFRSPGWTWAKLCGRAGWLGLCDRCHLQVDFRLVVMN